MATATFSDGNATAGRSVETPLPARPGASPARGPVRLVQRVGG
ncbi:hypothetical protein [Planomonospora sp. ID82291]|nr:hypothetical protein [Planomonospora sp. ID82291]